MDTLNPLFQVVIGLVFPLIFIVAFFIGIILFNDYQKKKKL